MVQQEEDDDVDGDDRDGCNIAKIGRNGGGEIRTIILLKQKTNRARTESHNYQTNRGESSNCMRIIFCLRKSTGIV